MPTSRGYSMLSGIYDVLGRIVFGNTLRQSGRYFLNQNRPIRHLLIIGGGTGQLLHDLERQHFNGKVTFVDSSQGMIRKAKKRNFSYEVVFRCESLQALDLKEQFDGIHAAFFFDQFEEDEIGKMLKKLELWSTTEAMWILTDFVEGSTVFERCLLWSMYRFFRLTTGIKASVLPDIFGVAEACGFKIVKDKYFYGRLIRTSVVAI